MSGKLPKRSNSRRRHKKRKNKNRNVAVRLFRQVQMCADPNAPVVAQTTGLAAPAPSTAVGDQSRDSHSAGIPELRTRCTAETQRPQRRRGEEGRAATGRNDRAPQAPVSAQLRNSGSSLAHNESVPQSRPSHSLEPPESLESRHAMLAPGSARAFRQMAVFAGDFDREAEAAVCEDAEGRFLDELVSKALVEFDPKLRRYRLNESPRLLAAEKLGDIEEGVGGAVSELATTSLRHARYYGAVLKEADELFLKGGAAVKLGLGLFDREWQNIRAGQAWAATNWEGSREAAEVCRHFGGAGAHVLSLRQHSEERIEWVASALRAARELGDRLAEGGLLGNLGLAYSDRGRYRQAVECHEQCLAIMCALGNGPRERNALSNLGQAYYYLGEHRRAIGCHEKSLAISRKIGDRSAEGRSVSDLGNSYLALGEYRRAIECHEQSLAIALESGDRVGEAQSLGALGIAYESLGEYGPAIERHERHLAIAREIGDRRGEGAALGNLGVAYHSLGKYGRAIEFNGKSLAVARQIGDILGEANALGNLGLAHCSLGKYRLAMDCYERQQAISRETGHREGEGNALWNSSLLLYGLGYREEAIAGARQALRIFEEIEDPAAGKVRLHMERWRRAVGRSA
jgi:tetratricopeptide (TPR) repeat protein